MVHRATQRLGAETQLYEPNSTDNTVTHDYAAAYRFTDMTGLTVREQYRIRRIKRGIWSLDSSRGATYVSDVLQKIAQLVTFCFGMIIT